MKYNRIIVSIKFLMLFLFFSIYSWMPAAIAENGPIIHIDPGTYNFPPAFEGETLSHDFIVANRGSADLEIKDVTHQ